MKRLQSVLVHSMFWLLRLIPIRLAGAIGAGLGRVGFYLIKCRRYIAVEITEVVYGTP